MIIDDEDNMVCMFILVVATVYQATPQFHGLRQ